MTGDKNSVAPYAEKYLQYFKVADTATGVGPDPVASAWLLESDWHDQAYQELLFIRKMHSPLLEQVYKSKRKDCFKSLKAAIDHEEYLKKLVNFLGKSRDDIGALSKEECHDRMMDMKSVVAYHAKKSNWRDETYERLLSLKKMYSCKLDDAYKYVFGGQTESKVLAVYKEDCLKFLGESLDFLANSRADIVSLQEEICRGRLEDIERFVDEGNAFYKRRLYATLREAANFSSCENEQGTTLPNWRDRAYEEVQSMKEGFLLDDYRFGFAAWSKFAELQETVDELGECITSVDQLFSMSRSGMAVLSEEEYERLVEETSRALERMEDLMSCMQKTQPLKRFISSPCF